MAGRCEALLSLDLSQALWLERGGGVPPEHTGREYAIQGLQL